MRALAVLLLASCTSTAGDADDTDTDSDGVVDGTDTDPVDTGTYDGAKDTLPPPTVAFDAVTATLGSPDTEVGRTPGEATREVTLTRGFVVMAFEVSQARYAAWTDGAAPSAWGDCPNCPVERVTWHEAVAFANAQSEADGLDACYTCSPGDDGPTCRPVGSPYACEGWRLPTEAEWEVAARDGGAQAGPTPSGGALRGDADKGRCEAPVLLDDGTALDDVAWFCGNTEAVPGLATHPVGRKAATARGLHDVLGNVWEWCHDGWADAAAEGTDPLGPDLEERRVVRGGGWSSTPRELRFAFRTLARAGHRSDTVGFRLVRTRE